MPPQQVHLTKQASATIFGRWLWLKKKGRRRGVRAGGPKLTNPSRSNYSKSYLMPNARLETSDSTMVYSPRTLKFFFTFQVAPTP